MFILMCIVIITISWNSVILDQAERWKKIQLQRCARYREKTAADKKQKVLLSHRAIKELNKFGLIVVNLLLYRLPNCGWFQTPYRSEAICIMNIIRFLDWKKKTRNKMFSQTQRFRLSACCIRRKKVHYGFLHSTA